MKPKINSNLDERTTSSMVEMLQKSLESLIAEINATAKLSDEYSHTFAIRFVEIVFMYELHNSIRIGWRTMDSFKSKIYKNRTTAIRDRYMVTYLDLRNLDIDTTNPVFQKEVTRNMYVYCYHRYKEMLSQYAEVSGLPHDPLTGEYAL